MIYQHYLDVLLYFRLDGVLLSAFCFQTWSNFYIICLKSLEILGKSGLSPLQASLSPLPDRTVEKTGPVA